eukprot:42467-Hanusia_phi.AAC.1
MQRGSGSVAPIIGSRHAAHHESWASAYYGRSRTSESAHGAMPSLPARPARAGDIVFLRKPH